VQGHVFKMSVTPDGKCSVLDTCMAYLLASPSRPSHKDLVRDWWLRVSGERGAS
jgi:hypothetical protein